MPRETHMQCLGSPAPCPRVPLGQGKATPWHEANLAPLEVPEQCKSQWGFFKRNTPTGTAHLLLSACITFQSIHLSKPANDWKRIF